LVHDFAPGGKLVGWTQGNLAGYPLFQFYFPFPFLVMALIAVFLPLHVAFKIGVVLPLVLFPAAIAISLRRMKTAAPAPAVGALLSLLVLFNDRQTVWGGNAQSLMAGEFGYAYGYLFFPLFLAECWRAVDEGRISVRAVFLEVALGLSHGYGLLFGGLASLFLIFSRRSIAGNIRVLAWTHLLAFLILGAWIVPLLIYLPMTTAFNHIWVLDRADDLLPPMLTPIALMALLALVAEFISVVRCRRMVAPAPSTSPRGPTQASGGVAPATLLPSGRMDSRVLLFAGVALLAILIYRVGYRLHVVDVRFLPFWFLGLLILAALAADRLSGLVEARVALPIAAIAALVLILPDHVRTVSHWSRWNFMGLESRPAWKTLDAISRALAGRLSDPRVFYEHSPQHESLGTIRIFENLPYLANRQTLEGIYIQSSICSPFVYYIQSELSAMTSAALPDYHYTFPNVSAGLRHLELFNAPTLLIRSNEMRRRLDGRSDVARVKEIGPYTIYQASFETGFARPIRQVPMVYTGPHAKEFAYEHFIARGGDEPVVVLPYGRRDAPADWRRVATLAEASDSRPWSAGDSIPIVRCELGEEEVRIHSTRPGWPIRLSMAFHPRWKVEGGTLFASTPGFFLIIPEREEVILRWSRTWVEMLGHLFTGTGLIVVLVLTVRRRRRPAVDEPIEPGRIDRVLERTIGGAAAGGQAVPPAPGRALFGGAFVVVLVAMAVLPSLHSLRKPQEWQWHGEEAMKQENLFEAERCFTRVIDAGAGHRSLRAKGLRWRAMARQRFGTIREAMEDYDRLVNEYPESEWAPEALYQSALSARDRGDSIAARAQLDRLIKLDPDGGFTASARAIIESDRH
jgi:hypothetical protein